MVLNDKIRAIVTGVTGMVGEGVLQECLEDPDVESVLIINRKPSGFSHPKLREIIHKDFQNIKPIENQLSGYNACYFCLGVSSVGMKEPEYTRLTYDLTLHVATILSRLNPDMTFCYVSGAGTDSTEKGGQMWARVKGKTENDLMKLPFKQVFAFRPGLMKARAGARNVLSFYKYLIWLYPVIKAIFPNYASLLSQLGQAMLKVTKYGYDKKILEVKDINELADRQYI
ncbi:NAD-dependent epimerase/dehydratase family protein [Dyadobacter luticola]|uniref:Epimerase n=1 Tax=Dyadobacter luticola TaxID=1979387 RepID=A0A5R9L3B4_9BACT|nr:NAD-dependent epimerase/dehydratase family protein [Dyadobacter luticola]TLV03033.1 epimerase [Dyadobacter luticola]